MNIRDTVKKSVGAGKPILGVGPMSRNCVDAALKVAEKSKVPLFLIASRRQVDCAAMGGGYVNSWTTETFAEYVHSRNKSDYVFLCRDHGGPWQNPKESVECGDYETALQSSLSSFKTDIDCGFSLIHIDPIYNRDGSCVLATEALGRAVAIEQQLFGYAQMSGKNVEFEFGTEDQSELPSVNLTETQEYLHQLDQFMATKGLPKPLFSVFQTGTKVLETNNCGSFPDQKKLIEEYVKEFRIHESIQLIRSHGIEIKEHNGDFLSDDALKWRYASGVGGLNVAPEFGQIETRTFLGLCTMFGLRRVEHRLHEMAEASGKWKKWTKSPQALSVEKRTIIAGHYLFSLPEFQELRDEVAFEAKLRSIDLDGLIQENIGHGIRRYLNFTGWL